MSDQIKDFHTYASPICESSIITVGIRWWFYYSGAGLCNLFFLSATRPHFLQTNFGFLTISANLSNFLEMSFSFHLQSGFSFLAILSTYTLCGENAFSSILNIQLLMMQSRWLTPFFCWHRQNYGIWYTRLSIPSELIPDKWWLMSQK